MHEGMAKRHYARALAVVLFVNFESHWEFSSPDLSNFPRLQIKVQLLDDFFEFGARTVKSKKLTKCDRWNIVPNTRGKCNLVCPSSQNRRPSFKISLASLPVVVSSRLYYQHKAAVVPLTALHCSTTTSQVQKEPPASADSRCTARRRGRVQSTYVSNTTARRKKVTVGLKNVRSVGWVEPQTFRFFSVALYNNYQECINQYLRDLWILAREGRELQFRTKVHFRSEGKCGVWFSAVRGLQLNDVMKAARRASGP